MVLLSCWVVCCLFVLSLAYFVFTHLCFFVPASNLVKEEFRGCLNSHIQYHVSEFRYWSWHELVDMIKDGVSSLSQQELLIHDRCGHWVSVL